MHDANPEPQDPRSAAGVSRALQQAVNTRATFRSVARPGSKLLDRPPHREPLNAPVRLPDNHSGSATAAPICPLSVKPRLPPSRAKYTSPLASRQSAMPQASCHGETGLESEFPPLWAASRIAGRATPSAPTLNTAFHSPMLPHPTSIFRPARPQGPTLGRRVKWPSPGLPRIVPTPTSRPSCAPLIRHAQVASSLAKQR